MQEAQNNPSLAQTLALGDAEVEHTAAEYGWTQSPTVNGLESMANSGAYVFAGALNAVAQPIAQAGDLGQVVFGGIHNLLSSEPYQLTPFSTIANTHNFGDALRQGLQYNPLGATALGGYDLATGTINGNGTQALSGGLSLASAFAGADLIPSGEAPAISGIEGLASNFDAASASSRFQGQFPYYGIDTLTNTSIPAGSYLAQITHTEDGLPVGNYFTTLDSLNQTQLPSGAYDANALNQGLQIYAGGRSNFRPYVQIYQVNEDIPLGGAAAGPTTANPYFNPGQYPNLDQLYILPEVQSNLSPTTLQVLQNTPAPTYTPMNEVINNMLRQDVQ